MSIKDSAKAAVGTAAVAANVAGGQGPNAAQGLQTAQQQQRNASSSQVESATKASGQPTTSQDK